MAAKEQIAVFLSGLDELCREESDNRNVSIAVTSETEEKTYENGKVVAINKTI